jgi:hypothetical protein
MKAIALALAIALAACSTPVPPPPTPAPEIEVPRDLRSCPLMPSAVPVPKPPRSFAVAIEWGRRTEEQRQHTADALEVCRAKLQKLLGLIDNP